MRQVSPALAGKTLAENKAAATRTTRLRTSFMYARLRFANRGFPAFRGQFRAVALKSFERNLVDEEMPTRFELRFST